jgi:hypothetical protein
LEWARWMTPLGDKHPNWLTYLAPALSYLLGALIASVSAALGGINGVRKVRTELPVNDDG